MGESVILQRQVTLDEALLEGCKTYRNGCNFRLKTMADDSRYLTWGCYPLDGLMTGVEALLKSFMGGLPERRIDKIAHPSTIIELLKRPPCACCGGAIFETTRSPS